MTKGLAQYITTLIVRDFDHTKEEGMCLSSYECEMLEKAFIEEKFKDIETWIRSKLWK